MGVKSDRNYNSLTDAENEIHNLIAPDNFDILTPK